MYHLANMLTLYSAINNFRLWVLQNKRTSVGFVEITSNSG